MKTTSQTFILLPTGLWLIVFMLVPLAIIVIFSFASRNELGQIIFGFHLDNCLRFFSGPYLNCLWRSFVLAFATCISCLLIGFPVALWLALQVDQKYQQLFVTLLTLPLWISFLLRIYAWITILRPTGIVSHMFSMVGISNPPIILYSEWAVLLGMVYNYLPYMILPIYAALQKLDKKLIEASFDLGATYWTTIKRIIVPLSSRGIIAGIIMVFVPSLGDYVTPDLMGGSKYMYIGSLIQNQYLTVRDWAFGSAVSTILLIIVAIAVWIYLKYADRPSMA